MNKINKEKYMRECLKLAKKAEGRVGTNPLVGAIITDEAGNIIGRGYHKGPFYNHAEVEAINDCKNKLHTIKNKILYVNLEPCNHYGRTPPCTKSIIKAGIKKVIVAMLDVNPQVREKGIEELKKNNIQTEVGILEEEAMELNEVYIKYTLTKLPFVILKVAMTLDGKISIPSKELPISSRENKNKYITSEESRYFVHKRLRNIVDAILVGKNTVLVDDPLLTTRIRQKDAKQPIKVLLDSRCEVPLTANIFKEPNRTIVATTELANKAKVATLVKSGVEVVTLPTYQNKVNINELLKYLGSKGITSLLIEGGARVNNSFLTQNLVDKVYFFIGMKLIGGRNLLTPLEGDLLPTPIELAKYKIKKIGKDILIIGYPKRDVLWNNTG